MGPFLPQANQIMKGDNKKLDDCECTICVDNSLTESVQFYTVKSRFQVTTLTCLDHLQIRDACECAQKTCVARPRHLVFLLDSSDSFNREIGGKDGKSWFEKTKDFLVDFIESANFDSRTVPTLISVYQFSGDKNFVKFYRPGDGGVAKDSSGNPVKDHRGHYTCVLDAVQITGTTFKTRQEFIQKIKKVESLDGNGNLGLALQDMSLASFFEKSSKKLGAAPAGVQATEWQVENILVVLTDTQWDIKGLFNETGGQATEDSILQSATRSYSRIYAASVVVNKQAITSDMKTDRFFLNKLAKPMEMASVMTEGTLDSDLDNMKTKIFRDLNL